MDTPQLPCGVYCLSGNLPQGAALRIRALPQAEGDSLGLLLKHQCIEIIGQYEDWLLARYGDHSQAWVLWRLQGSTLLVPCLEANHDLCAPVRCPSSSSQGSPGDSPQSSRRSSLQDSADDPPDLSTAPSPANPASSSRPPAAHASTHVVGRSDSAGQSPLGRTAAGLPKPPQTLKQPLPDQCSRSPGRQVNPLPHPGRSTTPPRPPHSRVPPPTSPAKPQAARGRSASAGRSSRNPGVAEGPGQAGQAGNSPAPAKRVSISRPASYHERRSASASRRPRDVMQDLYEDALVLKEKRDRLAAQKDSAKDYSFSPTLYTKPRARSAPPMRPAPDRSNTPQTRPQSVRIPKPAAATRPVGSMPEAPEYRRSRSKGDELYEAALRQREKLEQLSQARQEAQCTFAPRLFTANQSRGRPVATRSPPWAGSGDSLARSPPGGGEGQGAADAAGPPTPPAPDQAGGEPPGASVRTPFTPERARQHKRSFSSHSPGSPRGPSRMYPYDGPGPVKALDRTILDQTKKTIPTSSPPSGHVPGRVSFDSPIAAAERERCVSPGRAAQVRHRSSGAGVFPGP